ncbi:MAG: c-type cytochrome [Proteobacteria bacterium]|nr:c-type cytochrome [Pseudomonadota bacterium]
MASDLTFNKIAAGILATGLAIMGLREVSAIAFETEAPEKPGYAIDVPDEAAGGDGGPAPDRLLDWGTLLVSANTADGATASKKCASCHTFEQGGPNGTGPNLFGVLGGPIAGKAGYAYSDALKAHAGAVGGRWTLDEMNAFLLAPQRHVPGTKMTFVGLKKEDERVNLVAYLNTMTASPVPIPTPDPSRQEGAQGTGGGAPADGASAAPTTPGAPEGSAGTVPAPAGGTTGTPPTAQGGGMAGQTPLYGQPGGAPQAMQVSPAGEEGGRGQGSTSPGGGGTTNPAGTGAAARAGPATNPQAQRPTAQPSPAQRAPTRGGPGRVNEGNTNSASPGQTQPR